MRASVVIPTKNRRNDLRRAISSAIRQTERVEVIVIDDGSNDGTSEMVKEEFPQVRLDRTDVSLGQAVQRNRGTLLSSREFVFSIDDDAEFSTPRVVEQTLAEFSHPRIAAIAIPYVEAQEPCRKHQVAPDREDIWATDIFRGTAYALKRDIFLGLGGYLEQTVFQGEEMDYCIRLLNSGYIVRLGSSDIIIHDESPKRDWRRQDFYGRWNDILFAWRNVPMPYMPVHLIATTLNGVKHAAAARSASDIRGILFGYSGILLNWGARKPVSRDAYRLHRLLKKRGPRNLIEIENLLPPVLERSRSNTSELK
jgi:glycosyltransferase involved in cell wall biosynthesis